MVTDFVRALLREQIVENRLAMVIQLLRQAANYSEDSQFLNQLILISARFKRNEEAKNTQTLARTEYEIERNQIQQAVLNLLTELPEDISLTEADISAATQVEKEKQKNVGRILYSLPSKMQVKKPERCIIRIAPDTVSEAILKESLSVKNTTQIETLSRITKVMRVSLQAEDPEQFEVVCINVSEEEKGEQFIEEDSYTEWRYRITALQPGVHHLVLTASIIEVLKEYNNKEVKKTVKVFDKAIEVVSEAVVEETRGFQEGGTIVYDNAKMPTSNLMNGLKAFVPAVMVMLFGSYSFAATVAIGTALTLTTLAVGVKIVQPDFKIQNLFRSKAIQVDTATVNMNDSMPNEAKYITVEDSLKNAEMAEEKIAEAHIKLLRSNSKYEKERIVFMENLKTGKNTLLKKEWEKICVPAFEEWFGYLEKEKMNIYHSTKNDKNIEPTFIKYLKKNPKMVTAWGYLFLSNHIAEIKKEIPSINQHKSAEGMKYYCKKNNISNFNFEKEVNKAANSLVKALKGSLKSQNAKK